MKKLSVLPWFVLCLLCAALNGCGFALKGSTSPLPFKTAQFQAQANSTLATEVIARLTGKGVQMITQATSDAPRIALLDEVRDKSVASTTTTGRVREYKLRQQVTLQVFDAAGQLWLEPVTLVQYRDFAYNDSQVLAKDIEEQALYKDMQHELVQALMRRLETLSKVPKPTAAASAATLVTPAQ
jgi:LPS-assembly lipoprotein